MCLFLNQRLLKAKLERSEIATVQLHSFLSLLVKYWSLPPVRLSVYVIWKIMTNNDLKLSVHASLMDVIVIFIVKLN